MAVFTPLSRAEAAAFLTQFALGELVELPRALGEPAWHLYVIKHDRADDLAAALKQSGIGQKAYYRVPTHLQPAMREFAPDRELPGTAQAARTHLAIPMSPVLSREQADAVVAAVSAAL